MSAFSIRETIEREAQKSKNPGQAIALYELMSAISEECYSAGWIVDNGENLWKIGLQFERLVSTGIEELEIATHTFDYGAGEIDISTLIDLSDLAAESGCWWTWIDGNPKCILLKDWGRI